MSYIIVSWNTANDAVIVMNEDGNNNVFNTKEEARIYARVMCAWKWKVIET